VLYCRDTCNQISTIVDYLDAGGTLVGARAHAFTGLEELQRRDVGPFSRVQGALALLGVLGRVQGGLALLGEPIQPICSTEKVVGELGATFWARSIVQPGACSCGIGLQQPLSGSLGLLGSQA